MKRRESRKQSKAVPVAAMPKPMSGALPRRVSIFRAGSDQAVLIPEALRFSEKVKEVRIRKQWNGLLISPVKPDWLSFFALEADVPDDFLAES